MTTVTTLILSSKKTDFTTYLNSPIRLEPAKKYEAAFLTLETYNSIPNITEENNKLKYSTDKGISWKIISLPIGGYELDEINDRIHVDMIMNNDYNQTPGVEPGSEFYVNITFDKPTLKSIVEITNENYMVDFGVENSISSTLGFNNEKLLQGTFVSPNPIDIEKVNSVLIHCDFVTGSYVNSDKSNVIYSFSPKVSPGYKIREHANPELIFYPVLQQSEIYRVRVWLTDQNNKTIDLRGEQITLSIHIREVIQNIYNI